MRFRQHYRVYQRGRPSEGAWFVEGLGAGPEGRKLARRKKKEMHITVGKYALLRNIKKDLASWRGRKEKESTSQ